MRVCTLIAVLSLLAGCADPSGDQPIPPKTPQPAYTGQISLDAPDALGRLLALYRDMDEELLDDCSWVALDPGESRLDVVEWEDPPDFGPLNFASAWRLPIHSIGSSRSSQLRAWRVTRPDSSWGRGSRTRSIKTTLVASVIDTATRATS